MKKKIQFKLNERLFVVKVDIDKPRRMYDDIYDEMINDAHEELSEQIIRGNETIENIFFDELEVVCSECGRSLDDEFTEEQDDFMCPDCSALFCCECGEKLTEEERKKDNYTCNKCEEDN